MTNKDKSQVSTTASTVEKAIQLLMALSDEHREMGTTELGKQLGLHKATVSRILIKLAEYGLVYKNKETRKYWLGPAIHQLSMAMADTRFKQVMQVARQHVDELRDIVGETVALEIWLGNSTVTTYSALANHSLKVIPPGEMLALHAAAGAKAILSHSSEEKIEVLLQGKLPQITQNTLTDKEAIRRKLSEYLEQGYSVDEQEMHIGICAIAAPVFDQLRHPIAAITILMQASGSSQMQDQELVSNLKAKSRLISRELAVNRVRAYS